MTTYTLCAILFVVSPSYIPVKFYFLCRLDQQTIQPLNQCEREQHLKKYCTSLKTF